MVYDTPISTEYWDDDGTSVYKKMFQRIEQEGVVLEWANHQRQNL